MCSAAVQRLTTTVEKVRGTIGVGDMGSCVRRALHRDGDAVNVASRLAGCTGASDVGILVGEVTRNRAKDVVFREIDRIRVKGKGRL